MSRPQAALRLWCAGAGVPLVVLVPGLGAASGEWRPVQQGIAGFTRCCRCDRGGPAAHAHAPARSVSDLVNALHAALHRPGMRDGPCVLVGHSLGGLVARRYAQQHAKDVAGLVLVDAMHEQQFERLGPAFPPPSGDDAPLLRAMRSFWQGGWREPAGNPEHIELAASLVDPPADGALGELPLAVLTAGAWRDRKLFPSPHGEQLQAEWDALQDAHMRLSCRSERIEAGDDSGHFVHREKPALVVQAVERLVRSLRERPAGLV